VAGVCSVQLPSQPSPGWWFSKRVFERLCCGSVDCAVKGTTAARTGRHRKKMGEKVYLDSEAIEKLILERYKPWRFPPRQAYLQLLHPARVTLLPLYPFLQPPHTAPVQSHAQADAGLRLTTQCCCGRVQAHTRTLESRVYIFAAGGCKCACVRIIAAGSVFVCMFLCVDVCAYEFVRLIYVV